MTDSKIELASKRKPPRAGMGRPKGSKNKTTALLKDAILQAAENAGNKVGQAGIVSYLEQQASENPGPFLTLLGKVLPMTVAGDVENPLNVIHKIERQIVRANPSDSNG